MYTLLLALIYLAFVSLGLPDSLLGTAWPVMQNDLNSPMYFAGIVSMIIAGGTIVSSLLSERLTKKLGTPTVTVASVFLTAFALLGFSFASKFYMLCIIAIPYGLGAGAIDAALNNYVALHYNSRHMSWLHCFWGVGTIISPYIMSLALTYSSWEWGYRITFFIQLSIAFILLLTLGVWRVNKSREQLQSDTVGDGDSSEVIGIRRALKIPGVPYLLLGFLGYCAAEATVMLWSSSYLVEARGLSEETAAAFTSLLFIGITVGRFINGIIAEKFSDAILIRVGAAIAIVGMAVILLPIPGAYAAVIGLFLVGLGFAPIYPCIIHSTPSNFGEKNSQAIIGIQMASAYLGSTLMPPVFGLIADFISIKLLPVYILAFTALMIVMVELTAKRVKQDK